MKLELPLAVLLIAGGCWLAAANYFAPIENVAEAAATGPVSTGDHGSPDPDFAGQATLAALPLATLTPQARAQTVAPQNTTTENQQASPVEPAPFSTVTPDPAAARLIAQAADQLSQSPPISCSVRFSMNMFDSMVSGRGSYLQEGGTRQRARLELEAGDKRSGVHLQQVCDGRFYYRKVITAHSRSLEFVDLERVYPSFVGNETLASLNTGNSVASTWMMTGNLSCLIENLSDSFSFGPAYESSLGDIPALSVRGLWNEETLRNSLAGQVEHELLAPEIDWARLPDQIPHAVEITFGTDDFLPLFPYRISFLRFSGDERRIDEVIEISKIELFDVTKIDGVTDDDFKVSTDGVLITDRTQDYIAQIDKRREAIRLVEDAIAASRTQELSEGQHQALLTTPDSSSQIDRN
ncbi:MAG: hypothetical protein AAF456_12105 [Planctomycetota bacterium]